MRRGWVSSLFFRGLMISGPIERKRFCWEKIKRKRVFLAKWVWFRYFSRLGLWARVSEALTLLGSFRESIKRKLLLKKRKLAA